MLIPFIIYAGIGLVLLVLGILFYLRSVSSRKSYRCPHCGEIVQVELMDAIHCNVCGALLHTEERTDAES